MKKLHLGNVNFEWELKTRSTLSFQEAFQVHPNFLQLQFLPLLYAEEGEEILVTHLPPPEFKAPFRLLSETAFEGEELETWGWSENAKKWAEVRGVLYEPPPFPIVRDIASKVFSFTHSPTLPGAHLFHQIEEAEKWAEEEPFPKVLKTCYGLAGRGRFLLKKREDFKFAKGGIIKAFQAGYPLIGEPWVKRLLDFSTQWNISKDGAAYLGATVMENRKGGQYERTLAGDEEALFGLYYPFLQEHLEKVQAPLQKIQREGYYGPLGIDAMVYQSPDPCLHPIVEFNLRKTMGWLALHLLKKEKVPFLSLRYVSKNQPGLLPRALFLSDKQKISFPKQLKHDIFISWTHLKSQAESH